MRFDWCLVTSLILSFCLVAATVHAQRHGGWVDGAVTWHRRLLDLNASRSLHDDASELQKRDGTKYVFMHHIVGSTYHYTQDTWIDDIQQIAAKGVDAIALNIGGDDWQRTQIGYAYAAAQALGTTTKLFISFDFTTDLGCTLSDIVSRVQQFSSHGWQFKVNGKPMVSSYSGDCLGNSGWQSLKSQTNAYIMPFIWGLEGNFGSYPSMDSWYCWGCAWPQGDYDKNVSYIGQLGSKYATTVSMWFFTHLADKNRILRSDDWLLNSRWEQLVAMRSQLTFVEMVTWNDFGESDYFGPVRVDQPAGTTWADGFPHSAWFDMSAYYIQAFKTGVYPPITQDVIYYWARPHPAAAIVSGDGAQPDNWSWTQDYLWVSAFCTSTCAITLKSGTGSPTTFSNQPAGVNKLKIPLAPGQITVSMSRNGQTVISKTDPDYLFVTNPTKYNFNAFVGAASTTTTTTTTSTTTSVPTPTSTSVGGVAWTYLGCYPDPNSPRTLNNGIHTSTSTNTVSNCLTTCKNAGYPYAGVEYGVECWCASTMTGGVTIASPGDCNMPCSGGTGTCGGGNRANIYFASNGLSTTTTTTISTTTGSAATSTPSWTSLGCYVDSANPRTLNNGLHFSSQSQSVSSCLAACANAGYLYGGTEYGVECWCAAAISSGVSTAASGDCNMHCSGAASDICGGGNRISLYKASSVAAPPKLTWASLGCYQDYSPRTLNNGMNFASAAQTIESCQSSCAAAGFLYAGVEYAQECWCASSITSGVLKASSGDCNMKCTGSTTELCGGGNRINIYMATVTSSRKRMYPL
ncbi:glycosyl hydrolase family 71-domain-containing protein [Mycena galericulata]|nr:glycosyl hydrolase family 71-domain-containing protein [Mycena galericulata]